MTQKTFEEISYTASIRDAWRSYLTNHISHAMMMGEISEDQVKLMSNEAATPLPDGRLELSVTLPNHRKIVFHVPEGQWWYKDQEDRTGGNKATFLP